MLAPNMTFSSELGNTVAILNKLGSDGHADVYAVSVNGSEAFKALKWFRNPDDQWNQQLFENARKLSKVESPDPNMLWIEDIVADENGYGYIFPLLSSEYIPLYKILVKPGLYSNGVACTCAIDYLRAMRNTHNQGFLFFTVDGIYNCYINPENGHLLIGNCERVAYMGDPLSISYPLSRYAAPELITGNHTQSRLSNRYSLALVLFMILFRGHPLEGKAAVPPCMTPLIERHIYGEHPVFIFDPDDDSNAPIPGIHAAVEKYWSAAPDYLKTIFEKAFSQEALHNPNVRPREYDFEEVILRYRNDLDKSE